MPDVSHLQLVDVSPPTARALPRTWDAPSLARAFVGRHLTGLPDELVESADLLVSEVVCNAIRHGGDDIRLRLTRTATGARVEVSDDGDRLPAISAVMPAPHQVGGRGLLIIDALAHAWGVTRSRAVPGKTVWFEVAGTR